MSIFRKNSVLARDLGPAGAEFIDHLAGSIQRILPHVIVSKWEERGYQNPGSVYTSAARTEIRFTIGFGGSDTPHSRSLTSSVRRRSSNGGKAAKKTLDETEYKVCKAIFERTQEIADDLNGRPLPDFSSETMQALRSSFDESVISRHLQTHFALELHVGSVFRALRRLSEQTYENKALVFGCLLGGDASSRHHSTKFPDPFLYSKKYKALSDGFRTAYEVTSSGAVSGFVDLDTYTARELTEKHYYPDWSKPLARASLKERCAIALTRQGDVLVFDRGILRFTYRYGQWQYWNHKHVVDLIRDQARAQRVPPKILGRVVGAIYRVALDVSFRRSGGLFVILHNRKDLEKIVRHGDAIDDPEREYVDSEFDFVVRRHKMQSLPRAVAVEYASLDGAIVLANSGEILAYGAVLQPKRTGRLRGTEGSRTKAAIGASNYGLAIKISSDGDISIYHAGKRFLSI